MTDGLASLGLLDGFDENEGGDEEDHHGGKDGRGDAQSDSSRRKGSSDGTRASPKRIGRKKSDLFAASETRKCSICLQVKAKTEFHGGQGTALGGVHMLMRLS